MNQRIVTAFVAHLDVLPWDMDAADHLGKLRTDLEKQGTPIGNMDMLITSHALIEKCVLVSNNLREFKRVPGLKYENWV